MKKIIIMVALSLVSLFCSCVPGDTIEALYTNAIYPNAHDNLGNEARYWGEGWFSDTYSFTGDDFVNLELGQGCRLRRSTTVTVYSSTWKEIVFDIAEYDTDEMHQTQGTQKVVYINTPGVYLMTAYAEFYTTSSSGLRRLKIEKNASTFLMANVDPASNLNYLYISNVSYLEQGDVLKLYAYQNSGVNAYIGTSHEDLAFSVQRIGY